MSQASTPIAAGALAGTVALLVFVTLHAAWITPIWYMLAMLPIAAGVGALGAWSFRELRLPGSAPLDGALFGVVLLATLAPTAIAGVVLGPVDQQRIDWARVLLQLLLAAPAGAAIGLALGGSPAAAGALGVTGTAFALTLGHNLPFFPLGSYGWEKLFGLLVGATVAAGVTFGVARALRNALGPGERAHFRT